MAQNAIQNHPRHVKTVMITLEKNMRDREEVNLKTNDTGLSI